MDGFFVGIYDPVDVRRNILESSRLIVNSLLSYSKLEKIRTQKILMLRGMKKTMKELDMLVSKLQERLPETHLRYATEKTATDSPEKLGLLLGKLEEELRKVESDLSSA